MWGNAIRIARIHGFEIKVDASWLLIAALIVWSLATAYFPVEFPDARTPALLVMAVAAMLGLFGSLIVHELAHAIVARRFGLRISGITLFLFGGVAELQSEPVSGATEFWIAIAGPFASFCLALGFWFSALVSDIIGLPAAALSIFGYLAVINLVLALFNLLPAFPMDGGRVLRAWLWTRSSDLVMSTRHAVTVSNVIAYGVIALGLYAVFSGALAAGLWPILIGLFLLATSRASLARLETEVAFDGRTVATFMTRDPWTARVDQSLSDLVNNVFLEHAITFAPVLEDGTLLGYVDTQIVRKIDREHWTTVMVEDVIENVNNDNSVSCDMTGLDLMARIMKTGRRKFLVVDAERLAGVITLTDVLAVINVSREVGPAPHQSYSRTAPE